MPSRAQPHRKSSLLLRHSDSDMGRAFRQENESTLPLQRGNVDIFFNRQRVLRNCRLFRAAAAVFVAMAQPGADLRELAPFQASFAVHSLTALQFRAPQGNNLRGGGRGRLPHQSVGLLRRRTAAESGGGARIARVLPRGEYTQRPTAIRMSGAQLFETVGNGEPFNRQTIPLQEQGAETGVLQRPGSFRLVA